MRKVAEYVNLIQHRGDGLIQCHLLRCRSPDRAGVWPSGQRAANEVSVPVHGVCALIGSRIRRRPPPSQWNFRRFGQSLQGILDGGLVPQAGPVCEVRGGNCQLFGVVSDLAMYLRLRTATGVPSKGPGAVPIKTESDSPHRGGRYG